jgi:hypothetical protein
MVQAILAGRKTMTRRVIKNKGLINRLDLEENLTIATFIVQAIGDDFTPEVFSPYQPGDRLWVRETWEEVILPDGQKFYGYKAESCWDEKIINWKPSIFMPKEAARIWLEVTNVRVERLQEITEEDAMGEGLRIGIGGQPYFSCRDAFIALWNNLNAKRGYGWDTNPWVWVIEFKPI